jgi:D-sedoheptulose 7-phosphate isomerase
VNHSNEVSISRVKHEIANAALVMAAMAVDDALHAAVASAAEACVRSLRGGGKVLFCGNGGSAADAQHLAGEFVSRFNFDRNSLGAIALTTDTSVLTAIANDYGYEHVFERQVQGLGRPGDVLVGISTSGRSRNVLAAMEAARQINIVTVGMTGNQQERIVELADICICIPSRYTPKIQEGHIVCGHALCAIVESQLFKEPGKEPGESATTA